MSNEPTRIDQWIEHIDQKLSEIDFQPDLSIEDLDSKGQPKCKALGINVFKSKLSDLIGEKIGTETQSQKAGLISALATLNIDKYRSLVKEHQPAEPSFESSDSDELSFEAFVTTEIDKYQSLNIVYNILASRQDNFSEAFFPTMVMHPGIGAIETRVDRQELVEYAEHNQDGSLLELNRRNILDIYEDVGAIEQDSIRLLPHLESEDDPIGEKYFVSADQVPTRKIHYGGGDVDYRPLKPDTSINVISLAQRTRSPFDQPFDYTEGLMHIALDTLYIELENASAKRIVPIQVSKLPRAEFNKAHETMGRETMLNFVTDSIYVHADMLDVNGESLGDFAEFADDDILRIEMTVNGRASFEVGDLEINPGRTRVIAAVDAQGNVSSSDTSARVIGFDLEIIRSNVNWRAYGSLVDTTTYREMHAIYPRHPITSFKSTNETANNASKLVSMINAARFRARNSAITALFDYADQLESQKHAIERKQPVNVTGVSRYVVSAFYDRREIDLSDRTSDNYVFGEAVYQKKAHVISTELRDVVSKMLSETGYSSALSFAEVGDKIKPKILIGCHVEDEQYLYIADDMQLLSTEVDYRIVSTSDKRMKDTIFITFTRDEPSLESGLNFGVHAYIPELIEKVVTTRSNVVSEHHRVTPRYAHIPMLPILARFDLKK